MSEKTVADTVAGVRVYGVVLSGMSYREVTDFATLYNPISLGVNSLLIIMSPIQAPQRFLPSNTIHGNLDRIAASV